jgi:hypothetical protein
MCSASWGSLGLRHIFLFAVLQQAQGVAMLKTSLTTGTLGSVVLTENEKTYIVKDKEKLYFLQKSNSI